MLRHLILDADRFLQNAESLTTVEYAVAITLLLAAGITSVFLLGKSTNTTV
jgi:hypothetical protein